MSFTDSGASRFESFFTRSSASTRTAAQIELLLVPNVHVGKIDDNRNSLFGRETGLSFTSAYDTILAGYQAGRSLTSGHTNIGIGTLALYSGTTMYNNIGIGRGALESATDVGTNNTIAIGHAAVYQSNTLASCIAMGNSGGAGDGASILKLNNDTNVIAIGTQTGKHSTASRSNGIILGASAVLPDKDNVFWFGASMTDGGTGARWYSYYQRSDVNNASNVTLLASEVLSGWIFRFGQTADRTDTFPTAANLVSSGCGVGAELSNRIVEYYNGSTTRTQTLITNTGLTLSGAMTVPPGVTARFSIRYTNTGSGTEAVSIFRRGESELTAASIGVTVEAWDAGLDALAALATTGVMVATAADTFATRTITGTASRVSVSNGSGVAGNPTIDIDSAYVGQSSITTLGTVTTGTWNATAIGVTYGGTGLASYTIGDLLYASGATTIAKLADVAVGRVLTSGGVGVAPAYSATPTLGVAGTTLGTLSLTGNTSGTALITPQAAAGTPTLTLPNASGTFAVSVGAPLSLSATTGAISWSGAALTKVDDTNVTLTLGGSPATALGVAASITAGWTGTLAVARGGSGTGTLTGLLQGNGTSAFTVVTNSTTVGQILRVTGSNAYGWGALDLADSDAVTGILPMGNGGTGAALVDPNADRFVFWDDSASSMAFLTPGTGLTITTTTVDVATASATVSGIVELATDAETVTGTDTIRATTPANLVAKMAAPGAIGGTTASPITGTTINSTASTVGIYQLAGATALVGSGGGHALRSPSSAINDILTTSTANTFSNDTQTFTVRAGTVRMTIATGVQVGAAPTGGDKGAGTINLAADIYKNNTAYTNPDYVFEHAYTGRIKLFADSPGADVYDGLMPLSELRAFTRKNLRLPGISDNPAGAFARSDIALEKIEELALYALELHERVSMLEAA